MASRPFRLANSKIPHGTTAAFVGLSGAEKSTLIDAGMAGVIFVLKAGRIVEHGIHEEFYERGETYREIFNAPARGPKPRQNIKNFRRGVWRPIQRTEGRVDELRAGLPNVFLGSPALNFSCRD